MISSGSAISFGSYLIDLVSVALFSEILSRSSILTFSFSFTVSIGSGRLVSGISSLGTSCAACGVDITLMVMLSTLVTVHVDELEFASLSCFFTDLAVCLFYLLIVMLTDILFRFIEMINFQATSNLFHIL